MPLSWDLPSDEGPRSVFPGRLSGGSGARDLREARKGQPGWSASANPNPWARKEVFLLERCASGPRVRGPPLPLAEPFSESLAQPDGITGL